MECALVWLVRRLIIRHQVLVSNPSLLDELFFMNQPATALFACAGLLTEALLSFDKAIECEPGPRSAPRMYNRAYLLRRMGRLQDAAAGFGAAMNLDVNEAPRCSAAIAKIETQVRQRGAASAERHAPLSPESPPPVAEPVRAGGLYLCSCDQLQPKWRDLLPSSASAASVDNSVGLPKLQGGILETVAPPHANHATLVSRG